MLVKIFKIITTLTLVAILVTLVTKRDLRVFVESTVEDVFTTNVAVNTQVLTVEDQLLIEQTASTKKESGVIVDLTRNPPSAPAVTKNELELMPKSTVYEETIESHSDTDESYRPIVSPCSVAMGFKVGEFDTRFGISKQEFINEIETGSKIWEDAIGKNLFMYSESGPLTINLIFDERQARTVDVGYLALEIENTKAAAENLKNTYEKDRITYEQNALSFTSDGETFKASYKIYEDKVATYNAQGGASQSEYDAMMTELARLQNESKLLEERRQKLLIDMDTINGHVVKYNELVSYINGLIKKSNSLGGKKFTEGRFVPSSNTIDIYQFNDRTKLRRVIAHELGHVLGINHNDNVYSIMYSVNSANSTNLTNEDITSLKVACAR